jgi:hypothetical protein
MIENQSGLRKTHHYYAFIILKSIIAQLHANSTKEAPYLSWGGEGGGELRTNGKECAFNPTRTTLKGSASRCRTFN